MLHLLFVMAGHGRFNNVEMTDMLLIFGETHQNSREAARLYAERFPGRNVYPRHTEFVILRDRLRNTGQFAPHGGARGK